MFEKIGHAKGIGRVEETFNRILKHSGRPFRETKSCLTKRVQNEIIDGMEILHVDIKEYATSARSRPMIARETVKSLRTGFVYVSHGMEQGFIDDIYSILEKFFDLPEDTKARNPRYSYLGSETAESSDTPDYKEMLNFTSPMPAHHPLLLKYPSKYNSLSENCGFDEKEIEMLDLFAEQVQQVQRTVLQILASGLGCGARFFDRMTDHAPTLTRAIHYPAISNPTQMWAAEHDDINLITALPRATTSGLEVLIEEDWVAASPPSDAMIINTGIMMNHLTNGKIPAGTHRVISDGSEKDRFSIVQFCHPTPGTILQPIQNCVTDDRPQKFDAVTAEELLDSVIWKIASKNR